MLRRSLGRNILACLAAAIIVLSAGASATASSTVEEPDVVVGDLDQLSTTEIALLRSDAPKVVNVDAYSGDITSVISGTGAGSASLMAVVTCRSGVSCWHKRPPLLSIGFSRGVTEGTWIEVKNFYTGSYYAKLCWIAKGQSSTFCMPERNGANATISLGDYVTGKKVDLATTRTAP